MNIVQETYNAISIEDDDQGLKVFLGVLGWLRIWNFQPLVRSTALVAPGLVAFGSNYDSLKATNHRTWQNLNSDSPMVVKKVIGQWELLSSSITSSRE